MLVGLLAASLMIPEVGLKRSLIGIRARMGIPVPHRRALFLVRRREGVGMGDVWLLGMVGGFLGWPGAVFTLFVGSVMGAIGGLAFALGRRPEKFARAGRESGGRSEEAEISILRTEVPFGPFLALAAGIFALFQPQIKHWYLGLSAISGNSEPPDSPLVQRRPGLGTPPDFAAPSDRSCRIRTTHRSCSVDYRRFVRRQSSTKEPAPARSSPRASFRSS